MSLWEYFDSRARRFGIVDTKLALGAVMCMTVVIVKLVPAILHVSGWWFVALWIGLGMHPMLVFFGPASREHRSSDAA